MRISTSSPLERQPDMAEVDFEGSWRARYEQWAVKYDADHLISGWSAKGLARRFELLFKLFGSADLKPGSRVLDLGAGPGTYTRAIAGKGLQCIGVDYSHNVLAVARRKGNREPYIQAEAYNLPFRNGAFDAVVCIGVLQSLDRTPEALSEIARVLAPGGWMFLDGLNRFFWLRLFRRLRFFSRADQKRLNDYNPYEIRLISERLGFRRPEIHWLAVPRHAQPIAGAASGHKVSITGALLGHSFLLQATKA
jgi:ubiquinone/menaquinone biosynthesis C-methylase UbiE